MNARYRNKHPSMRLFKVNERCGKCDMYHDDKAVSWLQLLLITVGTLDKKTLEGYIRNGEFSHLCGHNWCINPFHIHVEPAFTNDSRKKCHSQRGGGEQVQCDHVPPCILEPSPAPRKVRKIYVKKLHRMQKEHKKKVVHTFVDESDDANVTFEGTTLDYMQHLIDNAPVSEPALTLDDMAFQCPGCHAWLGDCAIKVRNASDFRESGADMKDSLMGKHSPSPMESADTA